MSMTLYREYKILIPVFDLRVNIVSEPRVWHAALAMLNVADLSVSTPRFSMPSSTDSAV